MDILQKAKAESDKKQTETKKHKILEQELVDCKEDESIIDDQGVVNEIIVHTENNENQSFNEFRSNCNYQAEESGTGKYNILILLVSYF